MTENQMYVCVYDTRVSLWVLIAH